MAERLTESEVSKSFTEQELRTSEQARIYQKLGKLEDIMEKYGIESVEELGYLLEVFKKMRKQYGKLNQENCKNKQDRDTWKRACELACEDISTVKIITNENMAESDDLPNYFYQQIKKLSNNTFKCEICGEITPKECEGGEPNVCADCVPT